ncbi:MAG: stalk domain-containing protein [bacterium]|jgi:fibronectin type 3 domain-containing protein
MRHRIYGMRNTALFLLLLVFINTGLTGIGAATDPPPSFPADDGYEAAEVYNYWRNYELWDMDVVYTTDPVDAAWHQANGYTLSPTSWYISPIQVPPLIPLYRLWNSSSTDHLYTTAPEEIASAVAQGFILEGLIGYVAPLGVDLPQTMTIKRTWYPQTCHSLQAADFSEPLLIASGNMYPGGPIDQRVRPEGPVFQAFMPSGAAKPRVGVPGAPVGLGAEAVSGTRVDLNWHNVSEIADRVNVYRKESDQTDYRAIANLSPWEDSYTDTNVLPNRSYTYRVAARNAYGESSPGSEIVVKTPVAKPQAPAQLSASAAGKAVKLDWQDLSNDESSFTVERKSADSGYHLIERLPANSTSYTDSTVEAAKTYTYRIRAWRHLTPSEPSNEAVVKIPFSVVLPGGTTPGNGHVIGAGLLPKAPGGLTAKAGSGKSVRLEWSDNANNEQGYRVERFDGQRFVQIAALAANTQTYSDSDIDYGNTYRYRVKAVGSVGTSGPSNEDEVTLYDYAGLGSAGKIVGVVVPLPLPEAPGALQVQAASASSILVNWQDKSGNEDGFELERKTSGGVFQKISVFPAEAVSYIDSGLTANTKYTYRVRSFNSTGYSAYSGEKSLTVIGGESADIMLPSQTGNGQTTVLPGQEQSDYIIPGLGQPGYTIPGFLPDQPGPTIPDAGVKIPGNFDIVDNGEAADVTDDPGAAGPGTTAPTTIELTINQAGYRVGGQSRQMDAPPVIIEGRTMLPVRAVVEALGGDMTWDAAEQKTGAALGDKTVFVWVGSAQAEAGGRKLQIDPANPRVMPMIVPPGRTLLPLRFITENLGCSVAWDPVGGTITIHYPASQ